MCEILPFCADRSEGRGRRKNNSPPVYFLREFQNALCIFTYIGDTQSSIANLWARRFCSHEYILKCIEGVIAIKSMYLLQVDPFFIHANDIEKMLRECLF